MNLRQKLRTSHVKRWHIVETSKQQTVAEHSFNVCMIVEEMADLLNLSWHDRMLLIEGALHHDVPEVIFGDIPTPTKTAILDDEAVKNLEKISVVADHRSICASKYHNQLIKLADTLEAILFLAAHGVGRHAQKVKEVLTSDLRVQTISLNTDTRRVLYPLIEQLLRWETDHDDGEDVWG